MANGLLVGGGIGVAGYFGWRWWQREQVSAALAAEAARLQAQGMSLKDSITSAAAGACTAAAAAYKMPPTVAGPLCAGAARVLIAGGEAAAKGAAIAGKAIGKGAAVVGKDVGKGAKFVAYTAPRKVIGGAVNATVNATIGRVIPKKAAKVVKKVFCLGIFCGVDGLSGLDYRDAIDSALGDTAAAGRNPFGRARAGGRLHPNPFAAHARIPGDLVGGSVARGVLRAGRSPSGRAGGSRRALRPS
jgi:hypothetical protein